MSGPRHTPGPWSVEPDHRPVGRYGQHEELVGYNIVSAHGQIVGEEGITDAEPWNANLISAAPDMLAALKSLFENPLFELGAPKFDGRPSGKAKAGAIAAWDVLVESAKASIAKAEGRS